MPKWFFIYQTDSKGGDIMPIEALLFLTSFVVLLGIMIGDFMADK